MATIPTPPPPLPPLQRPQNLSKSSLPPPPPTHQAPHPLRKHPSARIPKQKFSVSSDELSSLTDLIHKDGAPSELVTSSVSTSPTTESDAQDSSSSKPGTPSDNLHRATSHNDDRTPRSPPPSKSDGVLSTSSMASSPRRPRRMGTGIPENTRISDLDFEVSDDIGVSARDEFEEEFLNRNPGDRESQIISDVLERVDFRQLSDDEEMLSDDAADPSRGESAARRVNDRTKHSKARSYDSEYAHANVPKIRQSTVRSHWRRIPSEVGCEGCAGCSRLCEENQKLRRQLDELEFELANGVLHNPPDGMDSSPLAGRATSAVPQLPMLTKKKSGWANKLRNASMLPTTNSAKPSERSRLKAEVQALTVTTEYLWRKLNKAENELRNYRVKDLRNRMELSAARNATSNRDGVKSRERHLDLVGDADWDWE